ncbi:elongation factor Ts [bacterium]|nr:elongation factor Ts [bacterium]
MEITAQLVKELRDITNAGMMDCKKALIESNGDMEAAIEFLRKKGMATAAKRADREANEGIIFAKSSVDKHFAALVELNCETDFVARNDGFQTLGKKLAELVLANKISSKEALLDFAFEGRKVSDAVTELVGKIGEKISLGRVGLLGSENTIVADYLHLDQKIGVLVEATLETDFTVAKDITLQIASMKPIAISRQDLSPEIVEKEKNFLIGQLKEDPKNVGKSQEILEKIVVGRLDKHFMEICLLDQDFVKDSSQKIRNILGKGKIIKFLRFGIGK